MPVRVLWCVPGRVEGTCDRAVEGKSGGRGTLVSGVKMLDLAEANPERVVVPGRAEPRELGG